MGSQRPLPRVGSRDASGPPGSTSRTGENIILTRSVLDLKDVHPGSITLRTRPYQQRRAYASARIRWPEMEVVASPQSLDFRDYLKELGDSEWVLNMLVGDTQRIWVHASNGFSVPQPAPSEVMAAYQALVASGFTERLMPR